MILISIAVITYNHRSFIEQAIESILSQETDYRFEIIIGDDCSTDGTREIILEYKKKYPGLIRVLSGDKNVGAVENMKRALMSCTGKYIAFCEGDDFWTDPNKLQKQIDFMESNPEYGLVHTDFNFLNHKKGKNISNFYKSRHVKIPIGHIFEDLFNPPTSIIRTCTAFIRNQVVDFGLFYDFVRKRKWMLGDLPLWFDISRQSQVGYIPESTATYRWIQESVSHTRAVRRMYEFHQSVFDIRFYYWEKYCRKHEIKEKLDRNYHIALLGDAYRMQDKKLGKKAYDFFKDHQHRLPMKHKAKYWAMNNGLLRFFLSNTIKLKDVLK